MKVRVIKRWNSFNNSDYFVIEKLGTDGEWYLSSWHDTVVEADKRAQELVADPDGHPDIVIREYTSRK